MINNNQLKFIENKMHIKYNYVIIYVINIMCVYPFNNIFI